MLNIKLSENIPTHRAIVALSKVPKIAHVKKIVNQPMHGMSYIDASPPAPVLPTLTLIRKDGCVSDSYTAGSHVT